MALYSVHTVHWAALERNKKLRHGSFNRVCRASRSGFEFELLLHLCAGPLPLSIGSDALDRRKLVTRYGAGIWRRQESDASGDSAPRMCSWRKMVAPQSGS